MGNEHDIGEALKGKPAKSTPRQHSEAGLQDLWARYLVFREECDALGYARGDPRAAELWQESYKP